MVEMLGKYIQVLYDRRQTVILAAETVPFRWSMMRGLSARVNESSLAGSRAICHRLLGTMCTGGSPGSTMCKRCCKHGVLRQAWDSCLARRTVLRAFIRGFNAHLMALEDAWVRMEMREYYDEPPDDSEW